MRIHKRSQAHLPVGITTTRHPVDYAVSCTGTASCSIAVSHTLCGIVATSVRVAGDSEMLSLYLLRAILM